MTDRRDLRMKIRAVDVLGCRDAEVVIASSEVVEVIGANASGKTSLATAAMAVATRNPNPLRLSAKDTRPAYIHAATTDPDDARAEISVIDDGLGEGVEFGEGVEHSETWKPATLRIVAPPGEPRLSTPGAVGMFDWCGRQRPRDRAEALQDSLLPDPEQVLSELEKHLAKVLPGVDLEGAVDKIREGGASPDAWAAAEKSFHERALVQRRIWEEVTGTNYGSKVAAEWRPSIWEADWEALTGVESDAAVSDARDQLAALAQVVAVSEADAERAADAAAALPALREADRDARARLADAEAALAAIPETEAARAAADARAAVRAAVRAVDAARAGDGDRAATLAVSHAQAVADAAAEQMVHAQIPDPGLAQDAAAAERAMHDAVDASNVAQRRYKQTQTCPHCSEPLLVDDGEVVAFDADRARQAVADAEEAVESARLTRNDTQASRDIATAEAIADAAAAHSQAIAALGAARAAYDAGIDAAVADAQQAHTDAAVAEQSAFAAQSAVTARRAPLSAAITEAQHAVTAAAAEVLASEKVVRDGSGTVEADTDRVRLASAEQSVEDARACRGAVKARTEADIRHGTYVRFSHIADALGPSGVRARMFEDRLAALNRGLAIIADVTGWPPATATANGEVKVEGRPARSPSASESECWRAQAAMQLTLAALDGSALVVLDRADLLDDQNRIGLVSALQRVTAGNGRPKPAVLVCSTGEADPGIPWRQIPISDGTTSELPA